MKRFRWLLIVVFLLSALIPPQRGYAQAPEPTATPAPTATPVYSQQIPLSSGHILQIDRVITYGDIAIVVTGLLLALILLLGFMVIIPRDYMRR